eukprot:g962.t1
MKQHVKELVSQATAAARERRNRLMNREIKMESEMARELEDELEKVKAATLDVSASISTEITLLDTAREHFETRSRESQEIIVKMRHSNAEKVRLAENELQKIIDAAEKAAKKAEAQRNELACLVNDESIGQLTLQAKQRAVSINIWKKEEARRREVLGYFRDELDGFDGHVTEEMHALNDACVELTEELASASGPIPTSIAGVQSLENELVRAERLLEDAKNNLRRNNRATRIETAQLKRKLESLSQRRARSLELESKAAAAKEMAARKVAQKRSELHETNAALRRSLAEEEAALKYYQSAIEKLAIRLHTETKRSHVPPGTLASPPLPSSKLSSRTPSPSPVPSTPDSLLLHAHSVHPVPPGRTRWESYDDPPGVGGLDR